MWSWLRLAVAGLLMFGGGPALAQNEFPTPQSGKIVTGFQMMCQNGSNQSVPCSATIPLQIAGSFSASLSGFAPATTGTPIAVTTGGVTGTLPAGTVVVASNVGATNIAYCKLGASATTSDQPISPNGGWFAFTVGAATQLTCITSTSTTTVNMVGGSGLATGTGGGGGGSGSGGAVTVADGADVTLGAIADAASSAGGTGTVSAKLREATALLNTINTTLGTPAQAGGAVTVSGVATAANQASQITQETATAAVLGTTADSAYSGSGNATVDAILKGIYNAASAAIAAGTNLIGKVGIDQTTPGTTNAVSLAQVGATTVVTGGVAGSLGIGGPTASGASFAANPLPEGCRSQSSEPTAVATAQAVAAFCDLTGKRIMLPYANPENNLGGNITSAMTATTSTAVTGMGAQGAGVRVYVTGCMASNTHATVGTMINLQDGSGGTTLYQLPAAPAYGGASVIISPPIKTTANTGLFAVNATTGANTFLSCTGYKGV